MIDDATAALVSAMVSKGNLSTATAVLQGVAEGVQPLPPMTAEEIRQKLRDKDLFPEPTEADTVPASGGIEGLPGALQVSRGDVTRALETLKTGSAAGQSGWSAKLLQVLSADNEKEEGVDGFVTSVVTLFNLLLRGQLRGAELLTVCRVAMLPKKDGGVRPIAVGDALLRALGATVAGAVREECRAYARSFR